MSVNTLANQQAGSKERALPIFMIANFIQKDNKSEMKGISSGVTMNNLNELKTEKFYLLSHL